MVKVPEVLTLCTEAKIAAPCCVDGRIIDVMTTLAAGTVGVATDKLGGSMNVRRFRITGGV